MIRAGVFLVAATLAVSACGDAAQGRDSTAVSARAAHAAVSTATDGLHVELPRTPPVDAARVETRGRYVQVARGSQPLER